MKNEKKKLISKCMINDIIWFMNILYMLYKDGCWFFVWKFRFENVMCFFFIEMLFFLVYVMF